MANQELEQYPRGQVALGSGDLQQCTDVEFTYTNNASVKSTLRRNPSGVVLGNKTVEVSGNSWVDTQGPEFDFFGAVDTGDSQLARFKFPGGVTKTVECVAAEIKGSFPDGDAVKLSWKLVGRLVKS